MLLRAFLAFHRRPYVQRAAVVGWLALLITTAARVALSPPGTQSVVPIYLTAGQRWLAGEGVYAPAPPLDLYRNPPGVAALFAPLTRLPPKAAELLWRGAGAAVFLVGLWRWLRDGLPWSPSLSQIAAVFLLAAPLALPCVNNGQTNLHIIGLLLLGAAALARGNAPRAGVWLAAGAAVKVYPLAVGLLAAVGSPRRLLPWLALGCLAFAAAPFLAQAPGYVADQYRGLADLAGRDQRWTGPLGRAPQDAYLLLRVWLTPPPVEVYQKAQLAAAAAMAGLVALVAWKTRDPRVTTPLALHLGCLWMTVFGPASETHTYTVLAPTASVLVVTTVLRRRWAWAGLAILGYALVLSPVIRDMFPGGTRWRELGPQAAGGLLLLAVVVRDAIRAMRSGVGSSSDATPPAEPARLAA